MSLRRSYVGFLVSVVVLTFITACSRRPLFTGGLNPYPYPDAQLDADVPYDVSDSSPGCTQLALHPANMNSPFKTALLRCANIVDPAQICNLNTLPYIGQITDAPTIDDIMDRVIVSDDWMSAEFKKLIEVLVKEARDPQLFLRSFRAVTAIVIANDLTRGGFDERNGSYCVDPRTIWLTLDEYRTLHQTADIRSMYNSEMQFVPDEYTYLKQGQPAYSEPSLPQKDRNVDNTKYDLAALTVHELAHANDAFSAVDFTTITGDEDPWHLEVLHQAKDSASYRLLAAFPLTNRIKGLAQVFFQNKMPTDHQKMYPGQFAAEDFLPQAAPLLYGATNQFEYIATLVEEFMMYYQFGVEEDLVWTGNGPVVLHQRRRIASPQMREPLKLALSQLYPGIPFDLTLLGDAVTYQDR